MAEKKDEGRLIFQTTPVSLTSDTEPPDGKTLRAALRKAGLSPEAAQRLHDDLIARNIRSHADASRRVNEIVGALQSALRVDAQRVVALYKEIEQ